MSQQRGKEETTLRVKMRNSKTQKSLHVADHLTSSTSFQTNDTITIGLLFIQYFSTDLKLPLLLDSQMTDSAESQQALGDAEHNNHNETTGLLSGSASAVSYGGGEAPTEDDAPNATRNNASHGEFNPDDDASMNGDGEDTRDGTIGSLTRRLRCLFSTITWPIVPLGTIVALALLWVVYAASSLDVKRTCSHPLHWYALASLILVGYIPQHARIRSHIFRYSRERDGPIRPAPVRMYDQILHTICLLYVYTGVTLIQTCREDVVGNDTLADINEALQASFESPLNSCAATCPNLYQALSIYVATLEIFTFALILPLLFLPCIYLWFLRRATAEAEAFANLRDRLREEETLLSNGGITASEILESLEKVKLVSRIHFDSSGERARQLWLMPDSSANVSGGTNSDIKECCICMTDFPVQEETDIENGGDSAPPSNNETLDYSLSPDRGMVRTPCGHIFHSECLYGWVGGRWQIDPLASDTTDGTEDENMSQERRRRRARQTCCPLCRKDLRPSGDLEEAL